MIQFQRLQNRSGDVRATADGFREDDLRHVGAQFFGRVDEIGEAAAEAAAGTCPAWISFASTKLVSTSSAP